MITTFISSTDHRAPATKTEYANCRIRAKQLDIPTSNPAETLIEIAQGAHGLVLQLVPTFSRDSGFYDDNGSGKMTMVFSHE
jgi:hypothetical protein